MIKPVALVLAWLLLLGACSDPSNDTAPAAALAAESPWIELKTRNSRYRLRIDNSYEQVPAGQLHYWDVNVMTIDDQPLTPERMKISGTMPGHGHGMATFPKATAMQREGLMRVKGMKFHMGGEWRMRIDINDAAGPDYAYFTLNVQPEPVAATSVRFSQDELAQLKALRLQELPPYQGDPSNRLSLNPQAAELGKKLFFDTNLSRTGTVSCATCHNPQLGFSDGKALSVGTATTSRHAPALLGVAHSTWFYWDGRRDSLWSQALSPLEAAGEMDNSRGNVVRYVVSHPDYGPAFERLTGFGREMLVDLPSEPIGPQSNDAGRAAWRGLRAPVKERVNSAFSSIGKVIAAFEESFHHEPSPFDQFVNDLLRDGENASAEYYPVAAMRGAKLFVNDDKTPCLRCHNGPLFTNQEFHNIDTGKNRRGGFDSGRAAGTVAVKADPFNCLGIFSDAQHEQCTALTFGRGNHLDSGAFKTPGLRNIKNTAPYFHDGRMATLAEVIAHYLSSEGDDTDAHEMPAFTLTADETADLIAFLETL